MTADRSIASDDSIVSSVRVTQRAGSAAGTGAQSGRAGRRRWDHVARDWVTGSRHVIGMNARNYLIQRHNDPRGIRLVNRKYETKQALAAGGVPVPATLAFVSTRGELASLDFDALPDSWACKPNGGRQGTGILLAGRRDETGQGWISLSGQPISRGEINEHVQRILDGELSLGSFSRDGALFEPLLQTHPDFARLSSTGLPDIRIICHHGESVMAMTRLPTRDSEGKANLHQGAVGAAVDIATGEITHARLHGETVESHPDTGQPLIGQVIPHWRGAVAAAEACNGPIGLTYYGADVIIDEVRGPLVLEVNARPGLQIQDVNQAGLTHLFEHQGHPPPRFRPER